VDEIFEFAAQLRMLGSSAVVFGTRLDADAAVRTIHDCFGGGELVDTQRNYSEIAWDAMTDRLGQSDACVIVHTHGRPGPRLSNRLRLWEEKRRMRPLPPCILVCSDIDSRADLGPGLFDSFPLALGVK
jgi:hypothetical protein